MESEFSGESKALRKYWGSVREEWVQLDYEKSFGFKTCSRRLIKRLDSVRNSLEVGFGDGRWIKFLRGQGIDAYGIDILEDSAISLGKEGFSPVVADARNIPFKSNFFDLTFSFGVIEHFEGTERAIEEHVRVTKPGGKIIISVPHLLSPFTVLWAIVHMRKGTFRERPATFGKRYTQKRFRKMLEEYDVENIFIEPFLFRKFRFMKSPTFRKLVQLPLINRVARLMWDKISSKYGWMIWAEMNKKK